MKSRLRFVSFLLVVFCCASICFKAAQNQFAKGYGDNAFLMELVDNIGSHFEPLTMVAQSTAISYRTWSAYAKDVCAGVYPLPNEPMDYFKRVHPYLILYILAPFKNLSNSSNLISLLMALSFLGLGVFLYLKLRESGIPILVTLLFLHMAMSHPAWIGGLEGQAYMDRMFVFFGGMLFWFVFAFKEKINPYHVLLLVIVAIINDRTGIQAGIVVGAHGILYWRESRVSRWFLLSTAVLFAFSLWLIFGYVQGYDSTRDTVGQMNFWAKVQSLYSPSAVTLWVYSVILLGPWTLKNIRFLIIAGLALAPNALVSVGGAERTGWVTHYHSGYLPALAVISAISFMMSYNKVSKKVRFAYLGYLIFGSLLYMGLSRDFSTSTRYQFSWENSAFRKAYLLSKQKPDYENMVREQLKKVIPEGKIVSTSEFNFKYLWNHARILFFPTGMDEADFILLSKDPNLPYPNTSLTFQDQSNLIAMNECMWKRMEKSHKKRVDIPNTPFVVLAR